MTRRRPLGLLLLTVGLLAATLTAPTAQSAPGDSWVDGVRDATRSYKSLQEAEDAGFAVFADAEGLTCIEHHHEGGMGVHYVHGGRVGDTVVRARRPEALVYAPRPGGGLRLAAVEYIVFKSAWRAEHPRGKPRLHGEPFTLVPAGNRYGIPAFYALHVWAWQDNPAGLFAGYNPDVTCP